MVHIVCVSPVLLDLGMTSSMYKYYELVLQGRDEVTLTYELESHRPAQIWASLINSKTPDDLRQSLNPWQNFDKNIVKEKVYLLNNLIDDLNSWLPEHNKIRGKWNVSDHQGSANKLHIHFPEQEKNETNPVHIRQLSLYNDTIHELEELTMRPKEQRPHLLLCTEGMDRVLLEPDDYAHFKASHNFGDLRLHYCHVGRHPFELYSSGDTTCPVDQIIPQYEISPYHTCRFYDNKYPNHWHRGRFKNFYDMSTIKQKLAFNDPKMAFGYINLGKLIGYDNKDEVISKVSNCNMVVKWKAF